MSVAEQDLLWGEDISLDDFNQWCQSTRVPRLLKLQPRELIERRDLVQTLRPRHVAVVQLTAQEISALKVLAPSLLSLDLHGNAIGNEGVAALLRMQYTQLTWLSLAFTNVTSEGIELLAKKWSRSFPRLEYLDLAGSEANPTDTVHREEGIYSVQRTEFGRRLEEQYGEIPWLHFHVDKGRLCLPNRFGYEAGIPAPHPSRP